MTLVKIYGFPRSGAHFTMALLARNFYPDANLATPGGQVGHWAHRATVPESEHGKLAGHHGPPQWGYDTTHSIYIYRDGRAVAASLWRSPHFKNPDWADMTLGEFVRRPLDWQYSPGYRAWASANVIEHWRDHLAEWAKSKVLRVRYEDLVQHPEHFLEMFQYRFGLQRPDQWTVQRELVGWFPSGGALDGWRVLWSEEDTDWFYAIIPRGFYGCAELSAVEAMGG